MMPRVSIIVATKNYGRYLPESIESILAQTISDWELQIVDDGSTDDTPTLVQPYLQDRRIRYLRADCLGQSRAKVLGLRLTTAEYVAFLDADDAWLPSKLEKQLALFAGQPNLGVCYTRRSLMDRDSQPLPSSNSARLPRGEILAELFLKNFICFSSVMIRRKVFEHVGVFDSEWDLAIDYALWLKIAPHYTFDYVDEVLVRYRTGHGNLSKKLADRVAIAEAIMNRAIFRRQLGRHLPASVVAEGYASTFRSLGYALRQSEPSQAVRWYLRACRWGGPRWHASIKGLAAVGYHWLRGRRVGSAPENLSENF
jgi:glycosyltransferase involved in cell wall biosynthesis